MVSNIYSNSFLPYIKKYNINPNKKILKGSVETIDPDAAKRNNNETQEADNFASSRCINKFLTADNNNINVSDILKDFKDTMTAIGVPIVTGKNVMEHLKQVHIQASTENPSISAIQNEFSKAAEITDKYISETLGKPSSVVKQWIDALFLQKINYKAYDPLPSDLVKTETNKNQHSSEGKTNNIKIEPINTSNIQHSSNVEVKNSIEINNIKDILEPDSSSSANPPDDSLTPEIGKALPMKIETSTELLPPPDNSQNTFKDSRKAYFQAKKEFNNGNYDAAIKLYDTALTEANNSQDIKAQFNIYNDLAEIYDQKHELSPALKYYNEALKLASKGNNSNLLGKLHFNIGSIYDDLNMVPQALNHYHASLAFDGEANNLDGQALTLNNVASLYMSTDKHKEALDCYKIAYSMADQVNDDEAKSHILSNIGSVYKKMNEPSNAIEYYRRALKIDQDNKDIVNFSKTLLNIGKVYDTCGQKDRAEKCYKKVLTNAQELGDNYLTALVYQTMNN